MNTFDYMRRVFVEATSDVHKVIQDRLAAAPDEDYWSVKDKEDDVFEIHLPGKTEMGIVTEPFSPRAIYDAVAPRFGTENTEEVVLFLYFGGRHQYTITIYSWDSHVVVNHPMSAVYAPQNIFRDRAEKAAFWKDAYIIKVHNHPFREYGDVYRQITKGLPLDQEKADRHGKEVNYLAERLFNWTHPSNDDKTSWKRIRDDFSRLYANAMVSYIYTPVSCLLFTHTPAKLYVVNNQDGKYDDVLLQGSDVYPDFAAGKFEIVK